MNLLTVGVSVLFWNFKQDESVCVCDPECSVCTGVRVVENTGMSVRTNGPAFIPESLLPTLSNSFLR